MSDTDIALPPVTIHRVIDQVAAAGIVPWWRTEFGLTEEGQPRGQGILVGVVDTGVDELHVTGGALRGAIKNLRDFTGSKTQNSWHDGAGHGTHVAGIIAGRGTLFGVGPEVQLCVAKALRDDGTGRSSWVASAIRWCVDEGCRLVNCSLGSSQLDPGIEQALEYAEAHGALVFGASGNDFATEVSSPADSSKCVAVGAIDRQRNTAPFSNRGKEVACVGPGVKILSAYRGGQFAELSGTSMSTPWITGVFACRLSLDKVAPPKNAAEVRVLLELVCDDLGTAGKDVTYGAGLPVPSRLFAPPAPPIVLPPPGTPDGEVFVSLMIGARHYAGNVAEVTP